MTAAQFKSEILILYRWELRSALRDRTIVINSIVLPLVLYPVMLWLVFTGIAFVRGQTNDMASRVAMLTPQGGHEDLRARFREDDRFELGTAAMDAAEGERRVRAGQLDAVLSLEPVGPALDHNFSARLTYDGSRERSALARRRVTEVVDAYREQRLRGEALARGVAPARWAAFAIERRNTASGRDMGAFLLGLMLPIFFVVMVALGCLNPAIDSTAGERERHTWETLMSTSASRTSIVAAKYLAVTTLGGLAGLLNVIAMLLTMRGVIAPLLGADSSMEFAMPLAAMPVLLVSAVVLAGFLAAGMMVCAAFARTFREGQSMVTPFYLAAIVPGMFLGTPGIQLTTGLAFVPVVNMALVVRDAIAGTFRPVATLLAVLTMLVVTMLLIRLAALVLAFENVLMGSYLGSIVSFLRDRLRGRAALSARTSR